MAAAVTPSRADYDALFAREWPGSHPVIDAIEQEYGHALDEARLREAARVLACPVKVNPPNWQHGRLLYAVARAYAEDRVDAPLVFLDVGTAKGFSALCLRWALDDAGATDGRVASCDVVDPEARVRRNTVAEVDGSLTLAETLSPWPEAGRIEFVRKTGVQALMGFQSVDLAFVDGKHSGLVVRDEASMLSRRQRPGDVVVFDDVHVDGVWKAVAWLRDGGLYSVRRVDYLPARAYAIATRL